MVHSIDSVASISFSLTFLDAQDQAISSWLCLFPFYHLMAKQIFHLNKGNQTSAASSASEYFYPLQHCRSLCFAEVLTYTFHRSEFNVFKPQSRSSEVRFQKEIGPLGHLPKKEKHGSIFAFYLCMELEWWYPDDLVHSIILELKLPFSTLMS